MERAAVQEFLSARKSISESLRRVKEKLLTTLVSARITLFLSVAITTVIVMKKFVQHLDPSCTFAQRHILVAGEPTVSIVDIGVREVGEIVGNNSSKD